MHLVWKRPDGFHGAVPSDFMIVDLNDNIRLWLHRSDKDQYPFRIAGGWEEKEASIRLNNLINLAHCDSDLWVEKLNHFYDHSMSDDRKTYHKELISWLEELSRCAKGDTWEVEIMQHVVDFTRDRVLDAKEKFLNY